MKFEVFEDNGGGITIFAFNEEGKCVWGHTDYEYFEDDFIYDYLRLRSGADPLKEGWDDNFWKYGKTCQEVYQEFSDALQDGGVVIVADLDDVFRYRMGHEAIRLFRHPDIVKNNK